MVAMKQLINEIETLSEEYIQEVTNFVGFLKSMKLKNIPETMILSEDSLIDWNTPEEDEAWADL